MQAIGERCGVGASAVELHNRWGEEQWQQAISGRNMCVPDCVVRGRHSARPILWAKQQFVALFVCLPRQRHGDNNTMITTTIATRS